jgi:hypothetical protein
MINYLIKGVIALLVGVAAAIVITIVVEYLDKNILRQKFLEMTAKFEKEKGLEGLNKIAKGMINLKEPNKVRLTTNNYRNENVVDFEFQAKRIDNDIRLGEVITV